jgi:hypothetical protein
VTDAQTHTLKGRYAAKRVPGSRLPWQEAGRRDCGWVCVQPEGRQLDQRVPGQGWLEGGHCMRRIRWEMARGYHALNHEVHAFAHTHAHTQGRVLLLTHTHRRWHPCLQI